MSIEITPKQLYIGNNYKQPYQRTLSRLCEMDSDEYFSRSKYTKKYKNI